MTLKIDFKRTLNPLIVLVFSLLFLVSCAEKDSPELPDFSASNWESSYDAILRLDAGLGGQIELLTRTDPGTVDLSVNGSATQIQSTIFDPNTALYTTRIFSSQIADGVSLDYELDYAGGHSTGVFKVPWSLDPVFPSFGEGDYSFEWTTTAAPQLYLVDFGWVLSGVPGRLKQQLSGINLGHTIQSQLWGGGVIYPEYLILHAINISRSDSEFLVYSETAVRKQF